MRLKRFITNEEEQDIISFINDDNLVMNCSHSNCYYGVGANGIKENLPEESKDKISKINKILDDVIEGFSKFGNFTEKGDLRFFYNYGGGIYFIGVGYITLKELKNGFEEVEK